MERFEKSKPDAKRNERMVPAETAATGMAVEIMPVPMPEMMTVAGPVWAWAAIFLVG